MAGRRRILLLAAGLLAAFGLSFAVGKATSAGGSDPGTPASAPKISLPDDRPEIGRLPAAPAVPALRRPSKEVVVVPPPPPPPDTVPPSPRPDPCRGIVPCGPSPPPPPPPSPVLPPDPKPK